MAETAEKCAHPPCNCLVAEGEEFCSPYCEDAGEDEVEISCDCGHPACGLAQ